MFNSKYHKPFEFRRVIKLKLFTLFGSYFVLPNPLSVQSEWSEGTDAPLCPGLLSVLSIHSVRLRPRPLNTDYSDSDLLFSTNTGAATFGFSGVQSQKARKTGRNFHKLFKKIIFCFLTKSHSLVSLWFIYFLEMRASPTLIDSTHPITASNASHK